MLPMVIEAALCLEQQVAGSPAEIDMALILGLGFPRYVGGPLQYADWLGIAKIVNRCAAYHGLGQLYDPTSEMRERARTNRKFY
jgi:3-hydroxyacyl-CoA dehydrogenase/enoyl-CoA hydratase/3-hydroxybutyryl-CoA epimerase/enoyl-CoA isomerase